MTPVRTAVIIAVGSELLTPDRQDTNSLFVTARLNDLGIEVRTKSVVGDDAASIEGALRQALQQVDLIVTTGGLGPTSDDLTREVIASVLGRPLVEDGELLEGIRRRFSKRGLHMPDGNRRQAAVPEGARVLPNPRGTAPGLWVDVGSRVVVLLPGPPRELQPMLIDHVIPALAALTGGARVMRRVLKVAGRPESHVEEVAQPIYEPLTRQAIPIATTILASPGQIELHLSAQGLDTPAMAAALDAAVEDLRDALAPAVFSTDGRSLEQVVGDELASRHLKIAAAESCTGGLLGGRLTDVPGSSGWFVGGIVAYANEAKAMELGIDAGVIAAHGAVSEVVARAMAEGARRRFETDVGVGITGIAGPSGGTAEKPVGTVIVAVAAGSTVARSYRFVGDRAMVRQQSVLAALELVRRTILGLPTT